MAATAVVSYQRQQRYHGISSIGIMSVASWQQQQRHQISGSRGIMAATAVAMASCMTVLAVDGRISIEMGVGYHNNGTAATKADGVQQQQ